MIKEIDLTEKARTNSWRYWYYNDHYHHSYEDWVKSEYKITVLRAATSFSSYHESLLGEEKDLTMFLLRWS